MPKGERGVKRGEGRQKGRGAPKGERVVKRGAKSGDGHQKGRGATKGERGANRQCYVMTATDIHNLTTAVAIATSLISVQEVRQSLLQTVITFVI